ncbi:unnamed protein product [Fusarium graminearum]|nr:unnamed protein product [Fusarium graminearum]
MAAQLRLHNSKETFQTAYDHAVSQKERSEKEWKEEKEAGLHDQGFDEWSVTNAPAYAVAFQHYQAARAGYETALHAYDEQAAKTWEEKVRKAITDNMRANGSLNYNILIGPDE